MKIRPTDVMDIAVVVQFYNRLVRNDNNNNQINQLLSQTGCF